MRTPNVLLAGLELLGASMLTSIQRLVAQTTPLVPGGTGRDTQDIKMLRHGQQ